MDNIFAFEAKDRGSNPLEGTRRKVNEIINLKIINKRNKK
ncbi:unnamed protein product [marine sediment metagenome]|uniref:Uncharacterized protein n=1 Tax=marine sediment metagenome TaxID=412755 RepID=X1QCR4_9ZZZZ